MSAVGFLSSGILESLVSRSTQTGVQKFKQTFQQLGQDLQAGNVSQAQSDLSALQPGNSGQTSSSSSASSMSQAFNQIAQDLKSGNIAQAQSDYATLQQDLQQNSSRFAHHHMHVANSSSALSQMQQELSQLGQALQTGNLGGAQQAYTSLQTELAAFSAASGTAANSLSSSTAAANVSA